MPDETIKILCAIADYDADEHVFNEAIHLAKSLAKREAQLAEKPSLIAKIEGLFAKKDDGKAIKLLLLHVSPNGAPHDKAIKEMLNLRAAEAEALGVNAEIRHVDFGEPGSVICQHASANEWGANYIVIGHRGRNPLTERVLGSVSAYVLEHAPKSCSVMVVRPQIKILVAMESHEKDAYVFDHAKELAKQLHGNLMLLHILTRQDEQQWNEGEDGEPIVLEGLPLLTRVTHEQEGSTTYEKRLTNTEESKPIVLESLELLAHETREHGIPAEFDYRVGSLSEGICGYAHDWNAGLLVIGRHQKPTRDERLLGRVSQSVIEHAPCSVVVVQPPTRVERATAK